MVTKVQFFNQFQHGQSRNLTFTKGQAFSDVYDVVLGSQVAEQLRYELSDKLILAHGISATSFHKHDAYPFRVVACWLQRVRLWTMLYM